MRKTIVALIAVVIVFIYISGLSGDVFAYTVSGRRSNDYYLIPYKSAESSYFKEESEEEKELLVRLLSDADISETGQHLVTITKPDDLSMEKTVFESEYLLCGKVNNQDAKVTVAVYDGSSSEYREIDFGDEITGISTSKRGFFTQEIPIEMGSKNRIKIFAYDSSILDIEVEDNYDELWARLIEDEKIQVNYFTVNAVDRAYRQKIINGTLKTEDYFTGVEKALKRLP